MKKLMLVGMIVSVLLLTGCKTENEQPTFEGTIEVTKIEESEAFLNVTISETGAELDSAELKVMDSNNDLIYRVSLDKEDMAVNVIPIEIRYLYPDETFTVNLYGYTITDDVKKEVDLTSVTITTSDYEPEHSIIEMNQTVSRSDEVSFTFHLRNNDFYPRILIISLYKGEEGVTYERTYLYSSYDTVEIDRYRLFEDYTFSDLEPNTEYTVVITYNFRNVSGLQSTKELYRTTITTTE